MDDARLLGDDRQGVRIPLGQLLAFLDLGVFVDQQAAPYGTR